MQRVPDVPLLELHKPIQSWRTEMKVRPIAFGAMLVLLTSTAVCAAQPGGRSSVFASPSASVTPPKVEKAELGNGRGSVYARDLPAPMPRDRVVAVPLKPGRT